MRLKNHSVWQRAIQGPLAFFLAPAHRPILMVTGIFLLGISLTIGLASDSHLTPLSPPGTLSDGEGNTDRTTLFVKGKILDIVGELILIVEGMDGTVELRLTEDTVFQSTLHIGDYIVASVSPQGVVRQITVVESQENF
ncbi:hypothetical protein [Candidatus Nitronereus thalassa]|uniref:DUF5666 domain-containing protein n=1 Tax=Candidatus Nitronereus thalassa TaxID=3020898 RepID=A0ABU3K5U6_9BACT|nr:hypothetical protein [Candidatus Nitronereus thalassa]MDT7041736.1 hypothetical protein [Candidatus Nitronereus thalassa]